MQQNRVRLDVKKNYQYRAQSIGVCFQKSRGSFCLEVFQKEAEKIVPAMIYV